MWCLPVAIIILGVVNGAPLPPAPQFNLYLNQQQSRALIGIDVDLFYVENGRLNEYALRFPVPVPANMSVLEFSWNNVKPQTPLQYKIEASVDNILAMHSPKLDIPLKGILPTQPQTFSVKLPCTGLESAVVRVTLNVTIFIDERSKSKQIAITRKKFCAKHEVPLEEPSQTIVTPPVETQEPTVVEDEEEEDHHNSTSVIDEVPNTIEEESRSRFIAVNAASGLDESSVIVHDNSVMTLAVSGLVIVALIVFLAITAHNYVISKKLRQERNNMFIQTAADKYFNEWSAATNTLKSQNHTYACITSLPGQKIIRMGSPVASTIASYSSFRKASPDSSEANGSQVAYGPGTQISLGNSSSGHYSTIDDSIGSSVLSEQIAELAVDPRCYSLANLVGEGSFGRVYRASLNEENPSTGCQSVLVKTVTENANFGQMQQFLQEGMMLNGMNHANIMTVIGTCLDAPNGQPVLMYPFMSGGNLKDFLRRSKFTQAECSHQCLTTQDLVDMGVQIAEGLMFLHRRFFLHKDVSTRNCMVDERLHVKITDNALARDLYPYDYHCSGDNENRPVKWMAIETLQNREYTPASDLWMFGVTLWELMTLGQQPYEEVAVYDMIAHLNEGNRLSQPYNCPDVLYDVMEHCWSACPSDRLTMSQVMRRLAEFYSQLNQFV